MPEGQALEQGRRRPRVAGAEGAENRLEDIVRARPREQTYIGTLSGLIYAPVSPGSAYERLRRTSVRRTVTMSSASSPPLAARGLDLRGAAGVLQRAPGPSASSSAAAPAPSASVTSSNDASTSAVVSASAAPSTSAASPEGGAVAALLRDAHAHLETYDVIPRRRVEVDGVVREVRRTQTGGSEGFKPYVRYDVWVTDPGALAEAEALRCRMDWQAALQPGDPVTVRGHPTARASR